MVAKNTGQDAVSVRPGHIRINRLMKQQVFMEKYKAILEKYLPADTVEPVISYLQQYKVHLRISQGRTTKLGDYRPPGKDRGHQISVNHDLNPYAFLITLIHEFAHLIVWEKYRNSVKPHGKEWKETYRELMQPFTENGTFPKEILEVLKSYLSKSYASSNTDLQLSRVLQQYDKKDVLTLEQLDEGTLFRLPNGRRFKKGPLLRKRYRCPSIDNKRIYLVNPLAEVVRLD
jgi:hypothetical protein